MKNNNKKGFTLIELLAVIVVLAIVTVIAASSVLPYMANAGRDAFATEANVAIDGASNAMSLMSIGEVSKTPTQRKDDGGNVIGNEYCFTLSELKSLGQFDKDDANYGGKVVVYVPLNSYSYEYTVTMHSKDYYVSKNGTITTSDVVNYEKDSTHKDISFGC